MVWTIFRECKTFHICVLAECGDDHMHSPVISWHNAPSPYLGTGGLGEGWGGSSLGWGTSTNSNVKCKYTCIINMYCELKLAGDVLWGKSPVCYKMAAI